MDDLKKFFNNKYIEYNPINQELTLNLNNIVDKDLKIICNKLKDNNLITSLKFNGFYNVDITVNQIKILCELLENNSYITKLNMCDNHIGDEELKTLSEALKVNKSINILWLDSNLFEKEGIIALSEALKVNTTLTDLSLWGNKFNTGLITLNEALAKNKSIIKLDLSYLTSFNNILKTYININYSDEINFKLKWIQSLSDALKVNSTIEELSLNSNNIHDDEFIILSEALKVNNTLTELNLIENDIGKGIKTLCKYLNNSNINTLDLSMNCIGLKDLNLLSETLKTNTTLTDLKLNDNLFHTEINYNELKKQHLDLPLEIIEKLQLNSTLTSLEFYSSI